MKYFIVVINAEKIRIDVQIFGYSKIGQKATIPMINNPIVVSLFFQVFLCETNTNISPTIKIGKPIIAKKAAKVSPNAPIASRKIPQ
jgi:hypothetical protein